MMIRRLLCNFGSMGKVLGISGSSGFIGQAIVTHLESQGETVIPINRNGIRDELQLMQIVNQSDVIINLAGAPIVARWNKRKKSEIKDSRVETTRRIVAAIEAVNTPPELFISASAIGLYDEQHEHTEKSTNIKNDFLAQVVKQWEKEAMALTNKNTKVVIFRLGIVLGRTGGMVKKMMALANAGLGATLGSGKQSFPFVHIQDVIRAFEYVINCGKCRGVYNLVAPFSTDNYTFTKTMAKKMSRPQLFRIPEWLLRIIFLDGAKVFTEGQRVIPERLLAEGFLFQYDTLDTCLDSIVNPEKSDVCTG